MKTPDKQTENLTTKAEQISLVNSRRLQSLSSHSDSTPIRHETQKPENAKRLDDAESKLRQEADQRLEAILAQLPAGKRNSLFKIRFGMTPHELRMQPIAEIARILKLGPIKNKR